MNLSIFAPSTLNHFQKRKRDALVMQRSITQRLDRKRKPRLTVASFTTSRRMQYSVEVLKTASPIGPSQLRRVRCFLRLCPRLGASTPTCAKSCSIAGVTCLSMKRASVPRPSGSWSRLLRFAPPYLHHGPIFWVRTQRAPALDGSSWPGLVPTGKPNYLKHNMPITWNIQNKLDDSE